LISGAIGQGETYLICEINKLAWTDKSLARAAHSARQKIESMVPDNLKPELEKQKIIVPDFPMEGMAGEQMLIVRQAIKEQKIIPIDYTRENGQGSNRIVHPLSLFYWGKVWILVGWCELRETFRHFRLDRIQTIIKLDQPFELVEGWTLQDYLSIDGMSLHP